jgi:tellurite resistance protein TerC
VPASGPAPVSVGLEFWGGFLLLVVILLAFDLLVVHRKAHAIPFKEALGWSVFWIALALGFNGWVWWEFSRLHGDEVGSRMATEFFQAYVLEKSLSVDNLFIFVVIFDHFRVAQEYRHRVLFYGILGALILRAIFIFVGIEILRLWEPAFFLFGLFLLWTGWHLLKRGGEEFVPERSLFYRLGKRLLPLVPRYEGGRFFVKEGGRTCGTTLLMVLFVVEGTDVVFALDSVPACLGVSQDMFVVYTSNVFAILGLRALFFLLQGVLGSIPGLQAGLALVLAFVGVKMILLPEPFRVHIPPAISLSVILGLLVGSWAIASHLRRREKAAEGSEP